MRAPFGNKGTGNLDTATRTLPDADLRGHRLGLLRARRPAADVRGDPLGVRDHQLGVGRGHALIALHEAGRRSIRRR